MVISGTFGFHTDTKKSVCENTATLEQILFLSKIVIEDVFQIASSNDQYQNEKQSQVSRRKFSLPFVSVKSILTLTFYEDVTF